MNTKIFKSYDEFLNRKDKSLNGVSEGFSKNNPNYLIENKTNVGCWNCSHCDDCSGCFDCDDCSALVHCFDQRVISENIPKIENIHNKILDACSNDDSLNMSRWHTCETTHCRAGWVVHLAGKAGYDLQNKTSCCFAAMQIYKASSEIKVSPVRFFDKADKAMTDMNRCAELECKA